MFQPLKARQDYICGHCGELIPTATYYELYEGEYYHIECLWDDLYHEMAQNSYSDSREYFFSLESNLGNWPYYGLDTQETYLSDMELVKHNDRVLGETNTQKRLKYLTKENKNGHES